MRSKRGVTEVTKELFEKTVGTFATLEPSRWQLYRMGLEAYLLILATWNFARFRYVMRTFKLDAFGEAIEKTKPSFERLRDQSFATVDFDSIAEDVKKIYTRCKSLAEQTGAAKIMHFKSPRLFVMWDTEIRKRYRIPNEGSAEDFLKFQKLMQSTFGHLTWIDGDKTLPKAIDEFNFCLVHGQQAEDDHA